MPGITRDLFIAASFGVGALGIGLTYTKSPVLLASTALPTFVGAYGMRRYTEPAFSEIPWLRFLAVLPAAGFGMLAGDRAVKYVDYKFSTKFVQTYQPFAMNSAPEQTQSLSR